MPLDFAMIVRRSLFRLTLGFALSLLLLAALAHFVAKSGGEVNLSLIWQSLKSLSAEVVAVYTLIVVLNTALRTLRYRLLLKADHSVSQLRFSTLFLATSVRNMVVDLLPSRLGELIFIGLLKRFCGITIATGSATLAMSLILDVFVLIPILLLIALGPFSNQTFSEGALPAALVLLAVVSTLVILLWPGLRTVVAWAQPKLRDRALMGRVSDFLDSFVNALQACRQARILGWALILSIGIRALKYGGLLLLFSQLLVSLDARGGDVPAVDILLALIASEIGASLPLPTLMSFGAYEAGGVGALLLLGYPMGLAFLVLFAVHISSQILDYGLGSACLMILILIRGVKRSASGSGGWRTLLNFSFAGLTLGLALILVFEQVRELRTARSMAPPPAGQSLGTFNPSMAAGMSSLPDRTWIVWSSNRFGNHDILRMNLNDQKVIRLTSHPHTETFPRISPDGNRVIFARSRSPWVSLRNLIDWDTYLLDLNTGQESLIAEYASAATWSADGRRIYFQRRGEDVVEFDLTDQKERVLFRVGMGSVPETVVLYEPAVSTTSGRLASTWRGSERRTAITDSNGEVTTVGDGCQLSWGPADLYVYWIDQGGLMENHLLRRDLGTGATRVWLDLPEPFSHEYFPRVSPDGRMVVLGASAGGHEHDVADYEIFLWPVGRPAAEAIRLTFHSGNDNWPDVFSDGIN